MPKYFAKACKLTLTFTLLLWFARANAQTVTIHGSCGSYGYVSWSAPTTDPAQVQLWEYSYRGSGLSEELGSGYSGESPEIDFSDGTYFQFVLYDDVTPSNPSGTIIAEQTLNCEALKPAASAPVGPMGNWSVFDPLTFLQPRAESNSGSGNFTRSRALHSVTSSAPLVIGPGYFQDDEAAAFGRLLSSSDAMPRYGELEP
jgi:hypothetical protein